jgi:glycosyltransferase involved in cell wall biosynthesis
MLFAGRGSRRFLYDMEGAFPQFRGRMKATGGLDPQHLADTLASCDLLVQPFEDGISARRSSAIAPLALGVPVATTSGAMTEPFWSESRAVALAPPGSTDGLSDLVNLLADDARERDALRRAGQALYARRFSIEHTTRTLRERCTG